MVVFSQDHVRRLARFKAHLSSPDCPPEHADADARWVSSQIDKAVHERLSRQTAEGGAKKAAAAAASSTSAAAPIASTSTAAPSPRAELTPSTSTAGATLKKPKFSKPDAVAAATSAGTSVREQIRLQKKEKNKKRRDAKREKNERIKRRKLDNGEELP